MKFHPAIFLATILFFVFPSAHAQNMDNEKLEKILYVVSDTIKGQSGAWEFTLNGMPMLCLTDQSNNRMRIISPVREVKDVSDEQMEEAMAANFHSALDVRYAVSNDILWVAYIHPLKELT